MVMTLLALNRPQVGPRTRCTGFRPARTFVPLAQCRRPSYRPAPPAARTDSPRSPPRVTFAPPALPVLRARVHVSLPSLSGFYVPLHSLLLLLLPHSDHRRHYEYTAFCGVVGGEWKERGRIWSQPFVFHEMLHTCFEMSQTHHRRRTTYSRGHSWSLQSLPNFASLVALLALHRGTLSFLLTNVCFHLLLVLYRRWRVICTSCHFLNTLFGSN